MSIHITRNYEIDLINYYVNQYLIKINSFNMLFVLNINGLVINYINLNDQINKRVYMSYRLTGLFIESYLNLLILIRLLFVSCSD